MDSLDDKRDDKRQTVLKKAQLAWGNSVVDCLVLEQSDAGVRVGMAVPTTVPEHVTIHLGGGAMRPVTRRWARGTEIGFEFGGIAKLDAAAASDALAILVTLSEAGLNDIFARLAAVRFFDDAELGSTTLTAQAAMQRFEAALRRRAEGGKKIDY
jgi:hypothetical protein